MLHLQVVPGRFELPTSTLSVWRSNQLSYRTGRKNPLKTSYLGAARLHLSLMLIITYCEKSGDNQIVVPSLFHLFSTRVTWYTELSRKEVFQPHLPVRLPCYDLAPITSFTLGRPLRSRLSGTPGFHGLTGGVYKARERIHRAMADARLLANPASWGRVADPSPN